MPTIIIPGIKNSGPTHWQTWLEQRIPGSIRVSQRDWNDAHLPDWASRVRREIARAEGSVYLVGHSFGALAAVQAGSDHAERIAGALLVAPADPELFGVAEFLPRTRLGFPVVLVASTDDPWIEFEKARRWSDLWGADFVSLGEAGHINSASGFGPWPEALQYLERLRKANEFRIAAEKLAALSLATAKPAERQRLSRRQLRLPISGRADAVDLRKAAQILEAAGWTVSAPQSRFGN